MVFLLSLLAVIIFIACIILSSFTPDKNDLLHYTQDTFFGLTWRWKYGKFGIYELVCFCHHCDMQIYWRRASAYDAVHRIGFHCEDCARDIVTFDGSYEAMEDLVKRKIQKNLRSEKYKEA